MSGLLTPDQAEQMHFLSITTSDDDARARIKSILAVQAQAETAIAELREHEAVNAETLAAVNAKLLDAAKLVDAAEARRIEVDEHEARVAEVSTALNAEKKAFEEVRQQVRSGQDVRAAALADQHDDLTQRAAVMARREDAVAQREQANAVETGRLRTLGEQLAGAIGKLRRGVAGLTETMAELAGNPPV